MSLPRREFEQMRAALAYRYHEHGYMVDVRPDFEGASLVFSGGEPFRVRSVFVSRKRVIGSLDPAKLVASVIDECDKELKLYAYAPIPEPKLGPYHLRFRPGRERIRLHRRAA